MIMRNWTRRYCDKARASSKRCFKWAAEEELISAEVSYSLRSPGLNKPAEGNKLTEDQVKRILP
jgi:hypothetical protein